MLYLVNDTRISIHNDANPCAQGGTSAYLAGFINYLIHHQIVFGLIGNFEINYERRKNAYISYPSRNLSFLKYLVKLFSSKKFEKKDIFYFQRPDHLACSLFSKKIRILHLHGQPRTIVIAKKNLFIKYSYLFLERMAMRYSNLILVTDNKAASLYISQYPFIANKIKVVPTGFDLSFFSDSKGRPLSDVSNVNKELVYIGRLAPPKQVIEMLKAFKILSDSLVNCHFSIAGTGSLLDSLKQSVVGMGLENKVSFKGELTKIQVRELIYRCDAAILLSANEGSPISIKEILACGKPVIVNDVGDLREYVIEDENGYFVNAENSNEVAAAIVKAFRNTKNMQAACSNSMLPFDESIINGTIVKYIYDCTLKPIKN